MQKNILERLVAFAGVVAIVGTLGCVGGTPSGTGSGTGPGTGTGTGTGTGSGGTDPGSGGTATDPSQPAGPTLSPAEQNLAARTVDYGQALRTAALKLVGA